MEIIKSENPSVWSKYLGVITDEEELFGLKWEEDTAARSIDPTFNKNHVFRKFISHLADDLIVELRDAVAIGLSLTTMKTTPAYAMVDYRCGVWSSYKNGLGENVKHFCKVHILSRDINPKTNRHRYLDWDYEYLFRMLCSSHKIQKRTIDSLRKKAEKKK